MDPNVKMSMLLEIYGNLLTSTQKDTVSLYYDQNLSLSEIAEELQITRQGVSKNLKLADEKLIDLEQKLGLLAKKLQQNKIIEEVISQIENQEIKEKLRKLL